jgi:L-ribulose-5-phosphate 4-epimerase
MKKKEVFGEYEKETGNVIVERFSAMKPMDTPAVLVKNHGPFTWGTDADNAVHNAVVLEEVAKMAFIAKSIHLSSNIYMGPLETNKPSMNKHLIEKHYSRKHGPNAYYGQKKRESKVKKH